MHLLKPGFLVCLSLLLFPFHLSAQNNEMALIDPQKYPNTVITAQRPDHPFWLDRLEVTTGEYFRFLEATTFSGYRGYRKPKEESLNHAVTRIHWFDAVKFCHWKGKRLPTEGEWELAAKGDNRLYPWGNEKPDGTRANYCDANCAAPWSDYQNNDGIGKIAPVGRYPKGNTPEGVSDMAGNLWEYTSTIFKTGKTLPYREDREYSQEEMNEFVVIRGGSYGSQPEKLKNDSRRKSHVTFRASHIGFRCAKDVAAQ